MTNLDEHLKYAKEAINACLELGEKKYPSKKGKPPFDGRDIEEDRQHAKGHTLMFEAYYEIYKTKPTEKTTKKLIKELTHAVTRQMIILNNIVKKSGQGYE